MAVNLKSRDFISLRDFTREELLQILDTAKMLKMHSRTGEEQKPLEGKTLGMIFTKPSTRTRISFEVGIWQLGGVGLFLSSDELQLRRGETIEDTAKVLSRYLDGIMIRTYAHQDVVDLGKYSTIPVINGLTDLLHPCQAASDLLTMREKLGRLQGVNMTFLGDGGNNMVHSLINAAAKVGMNITVGSPQQYRPAAEVLAGAEEDARKSGATITLCEDPVEAVNDADVVYADVWVSMGDDEQQRQKRLDELAPYQVNGDIWKYTADEAIFMHCLPAHRGEEVSAGILDGPMSVVFDQAENRLHLQKAIMALTM